MICSGKGKIVLYLLHVFIIGTSALLDFDVITEHQSEEHVERKLFNAESTRITNNVIWYDDEGEPLKANRGGAISKKKFNGYWYWVGSEASSDWVRTSS